MDSNPAKRRKTDHSSPGEFYATMNAESAAAASAGIFRPSTFILETAELLEQSRVDYGKLLPDSEELLRKLKSAVEAVETHGPVLIGKASSKFETKNSIRIPYPNPRPSDDSLVKLSIEKPTHCNVVGSFVLKTMARSQREFAVDMIVEMPRSLFQEKDYLNLRYFYKRAYYLANIAKSVSKALSDALNLSFEYLHDNQLLPILVATPVRKTTETEKGKPSGRRHHNECKIRIIPCVADGIFPKQKLFANKNCLRLDAAAEAKDLPATPFYNTTIKADGAYIAYLKLLHQTQKSCPAFVDACLLGRVWLQQRGFGGSVTRGGFGAFEWAALVALLMQTGNRKKVAGTILSTSLSSTQIFKAVVQFLSVTDLRNKPCIIGGNTPDVGVDALREGTPVLYDAGRQLNVGYKMSIWSAGLLKQYAKRTHQLLTDDSAADQFTLSFIARADIALEAYDMVFRIHKSKQATAAEENAIHRRGSLWEFGDNVFQTMKKALGDRAKLVHVKLPPQVGWALNEACSETAAAAGADSSQTSIVVGVVFDPANMARQVDHGPDAENKKEARKFREFWGERAELRRFKDGSIQETLVWTSCGTSALCEEITRYILGLRLGLVAKDHIEVAGGGFAAMVPLVAETDAATFTAARDAFSTLEQDLRSLEDLPLHIRQVSPIAVQLRSASIRLPAVQTERAALQPMEVVLYFEASGKWPDSLVAIQRAKMAFMLRIGSSLEGLRSGIETRLGLEDAQHETENQAFLDIVYADEAAFRLRVHSDLETSLLERQTKDKTAEQHVRASSAHLLATQRRLFDVLPLQNQTISTFCTRFPALSPTIRLAKRWFSAHKLSCHVSDEFVELVVLHVFLQGHPWETPGSPTAGLLRVLQFLARWDWRTEPLVVDTSELTAHLDTNETTDKTGDDAGAGGSTDPRTRLEAWRKIDPNMQHTVLFVAATHEMSGTAFTTAGGGSRPLPCKVVAGRMTSLARAACRLVKDRDVGVGSGSSDDLDARQLFQPSLHDYDVLIHLSPRLVRRLVHGEVEEADVDAPAKRRSAVFKNLDGRTGRDLRPLPCHPVQLLFDQLSEAYGGNGTAAPLVFFHGSCEDGDHVMAAMWNPQVQPRAFRINLPYSFRPVNTKTKKKRGSDDAEAVTDEPRAEDLVEVNRDAILAEVARIGGALIERIEVVGQQK
ncbi:pre-rRNA processing protein utp22 [Grosmannia clavigera kw1407]|uniref:U3 small nucleolar RNA-associated protein 22 n=1 Tax=Grosmannia clavigera (strain kw1407 / UAMH 11150) TaxID=655863 RepID=F0XND2_GROCL|nr:pre-rRNA processing protein utp22 [Grosmannia clavigera kw1407]EFX00987.1 pre-rRNA processing protein utp22 [Grosmannia clavigera kw1407]